MGWFSSLVHAVTHPGQLISDGEHWLGQVTDEGAHLVGRGLTDIGLGQVGNWVDGLGDDAANALDSELQLGQTDDPTQLIHGSPADIRKTASQLHTFSGAFGETASGLTGIDTTHWTGSAAEAFQAKYAPQPGKWRDASTASSDAGGALDSYAGTVQWAQGQAREAISVYAEGQKATQAAVTAYNGQVNAYNTAAREYDAKLSAGQNPGPRPTEPGAFSDPGASMREHAQQILSAARAERDRAGSAAASTVGKATGMAPASPGLWSQVSDTATDGVQFTNLAQASFASGVVTGVADIGKFVRSVNPEDPWNMTHPAEYLAGLSGTAAGLVHDAVHPQDLVGQMVGGGWGSDPFAAAGKLVPQVALAVATDGGGTAADAATDAGVDAATSAGTDAGTDAADTLPGSAGDNPDAAGQPPDGLVNDPVDVVTGNVVVYQQDAEFPGVLPLVVRRAHRSLYRAGRWFGRRWASTLDQRLEVSPEGVFVGDDNGVILSYPHPGPDREPVFPVAGAQWPLRRDGDAYTVADPQAGIVRRFEPRSGFYLSADGYGELPLVSVSDRAGHQISFDYTLDGAPQTVTHEGGYQVKVLTARNRIAALTLAGAGGDGQDVPLVVYRYDPAGNLAEVINSSGLPYRFSYDPAGRVTGWEDRNGFTYSYYYDDLGRCVRGEGPGGALSGTQNYDPDNRLTTHTDAEGAVTLYQLSPHGRVAAITDPLGNTTGSEHDSYGRLVARTDPLGRTTRWTYDQNGNLIAITRPDGSQASAVYNDKNLPVVVTEPGGATWRQDYDRAGNLLWQQAPDGAVTRNAYDDRGYLAAVTDQLGATTRVQCNPAGLPVAVTRPDGATTRYERDTFGRVTAITGPDGAVIRLAWTLEGHLAARMFPDGTAEQFSYDDEGNLTEHLDRAAGLTRLEYGCFDQVATRTAPDGTRTEVGYDRLLRQASVTIAAPRAAGAGRLTWTYDYDLAGNLSAQTDYNGSISHYAHDASSQLTERVNGAGQQVSYVYDLLGNVAESYADGVRTTYGYDSAGQLTRAAGPDAVIEIERDPTGRVIAEACNGRTVRSYYSAAGRRVRRLTPSGAETRWAFDSAGRPALLEAAGHELRFGYDHSGRETGRELPGGLTLAQEWDTAGRLTLQALSVSTSPSVPSSQSGGVGSVLQRRSYRYRADGALVGFDDLLSGPRQLSLNSVGRVTGVTGPDWVESYGYDLVGNITNASWPAPPPGLPDAGLEAGVQGAREYAGTVITRAGGIRYEHDGQGRVTLRQRARLSRKPETWRYEWDADDRLTRVVTPDGTTWRYLYDPIGRRLAKQRLDPEGMVAEQTDFTWDGAALAEQSTAPGASNGDPGSGQIITWEYEPGTFSPVAQSERSVPQDPAHDGIDERFYAIVTDLIGAPTELTAADGTLAGYQQHTLWGATIWHPGGASTPLRFPGQYADDETGLHYNYQRYYDPSTGRYLSPDPMGLAPAPNPHTYVRNPSMLVDPLGLACPTKTDRIAEHLTYKDLTAAKRELNGEVVARKPDGTPWDHVNEVRDAQNGLINRIAQIKRSLQSTNLSPADRAALQSELSQASKLLDYSEKYVPRT